MFRKISILFAVLLFVSGCQTNSEYKSISEYCDEKPAICVLIGAIIIGGVAAIINANNNDDQNTAAPAAPPAASDIRLKQNIRFVETLENGIRLHAFQYLGDDRIFVGVLAQEVREMPRFTDAVVELDSGYLAVDYSKLNLKVIGHSEMVEAGQSAISRM